jgi:flagellar biosynthesis/type III secretory pathway protein FliH
MPRRVDQILEEARQLPASEQAWLIDNLMGDHGAMSDEAFAAWQKEIGEPEPGYDEGFRKGVEEALADNSGDVPHEEAMKMFHQAIQRSRKLKESA